jgi:hypothetical protein
MNTNNPRPNSMEPYLKATTTANRLKTICEQKLKINIEKDPTIRCLTTKRTPQAKRKLPITFQKAVPSSKRRIELVKK